MVHLDREIPRHDATPRYEAVVFLIMYGWMLGLVALGAVFGAWLTALLARGC